MPRGRRQLHAGVPPPYEGCAVLLTGRQSQLTGRQFCLQVDTCLLIGKWFCLQVDSCHSLGPKLNDRFCLQTPPWQTCYARQSYRLAGHPPGQCAPVIQLHITCFVIVFPISTHTLLGNLFEVLSFAPAWCLLPRLGLVGQPGKSIC